MPVWHERTRDWRASGELALVGIAQEQHPDRCALFAQWQGFDWPILWDPFNTTGADLVPRIWAIDEHGIVRAVQPKPESLEQDFLRNAFAAPARIPESAPWIRREDAETPLVPGGERALEGALAQLLWHRPEEAPEALAILAERAAAPDASAADLFRHGVALRMRSESPVREAGDFQRAIERWSAALALEPNQYVWRRRVQQWGPRLDKPYPFYDWIESARTGIRARGEEPSAVRVELSEAERAERARAFEAADDAVEPDPRGLVQRDSEGLLQLDSAVVFDTASRHSDEGARPVRVHLVFRPNAAGDAHWNNSAEPTRLWLAPPPGWEIDRRHASLPLPGAEISEEARAFEVELRSPPHSHAADTPPPALTGYLLFHACRGEDGVCVYRRRDVEVRLVPPGSARAR